MEPAVFVVRGGDKGRHGLGYAPQSFQFAATRKGTLIAPRAQLLPPSCPRLFQIRSGGILDPIRSWHDARMNDARLCLPVDIRPAIPTDSRALAYLLNEAGEGLPDFLWSKNEAGCNKRDYGAMRAAREEGDFSYRNAHVVIDGGRVVAMLLGFVVQPSDVDLESVNALVRPLVALEQRAQGSWYINALAVRPECRGTGVGTRLIALAHALALLAGCAQVSLQNFTCNHRARSLYQRLGFLEVAREPMARELADANDLPDFGESILHVRDVDPAQAASFLAVGA